MKIKKCDDGFGIEEYVLMQDNLCFKMYYGANLDLYWEIQKSSINIDNSEERECETLEFTIDPENREIYSTFSHLIDDVISTAKFVCDEEQKPEIELTNNVDNLDSFEDEDNIEELQSHELMVRDSVVIWHSDDDKVDRANSITLTRVDGKILLTFRKGNIKNHVPGNIHIRFKTQGSKYEPFNQFFVQHFSKIEKIINNLEQDEHVRKLIDN